jgi:hypothetical protein
MVKSLGGFGNRLIATKTRKPKKAPPPECALSPPRMERKSRGAIRVAHPASKEHCMPSLSISSGAFKPEATILFPGLFFVRVERELDGDGWLVLAGDHGWLWGDLTTAVSDARKLAGGAA